MNPAADQVHALLQRNIERARYQVNEALVAAGRPANSVRIVAVSKYVDAQLTWQLVQAGCHELGESRPQSIWQKHQALNELATAASTSNSTSSSTQPIQWHMIGHLQRNKAARTIPLIQWLHSLDSLRLAETVSSEAVKLGKPLKVLIEINATEDQSKTGLPASEVPGLLERLLLLPGLEIRGLMAMSTEGAAPEQALREFHAVRELRDQLQTQFGQACQLNELSLGMSGDFAQGIAAGATMVRLGSLLWEGIIP
ncbi:MAG: YggS family pyridoxal phosphate-dependent enzyme [Pirellulaceae bacterium]|nr:YggS family pyridoxal phosphate-dependent enzyme [Pirellulaceae bacterium]